MLAIRIDNTIPVNSYLRQHGQRQNFLAVLLKHNGTIRSTFILQNSNYELVLLLQKLSLIHI